MAAFPRRYAVYFADLTYKLTRYQERRLFDDHIRLFYSKYEKNLFIIFFL